VAAVAFGWADGEHHRDGTDTGTIGADSTDRSPVATSSTANLAPTGGPEGAPVRAALGPPVNSGQGGVIAVLAPAQPTLASAGLFAWPLVGTITSSFGPRWGSFHGGIDLAGVTGEPIHASRAGEVIAAGSMTDYGLAVILRHADGSRTLYGHCSRLKVQKGQQVAQGDVIALVGSTGKSTGPHLHFEIILNDKNQDPLKFLPRR
ncbi:MAG: M23 family metallopeptidase, partial [Mycobacterium leprae]